MYANMYTTGWSGGLGSITTGITYCSTHEAVRGEGGPEGGRQKPQNKKNWFRV